MARFQELYNYDCYTDYSRFSYLVTEALGGGGMVVDDEKGTINYVDELLLLDGEYDDLIEMGMDLFLLKEFYLENTVSVKAKPLKKLWQ